VHDDASRRVTGNGLQITSIDALSCVVAVVMVMVVVVVAGVVPVAAMLVVPVVPIVVVIAWTWRAPRSVPVCPTALRASSSSPHGTRKLAT
jgi:hypothetical protein